MANLITKIVGGSIGLAAEAYHANKDKKVKANLADGLNEHAAGSSRPQVSPRLSSNQSPRAVPEATIEGPPPPYYDGDTTSGQVMARNLNDAKTPVHERSDDDEDASTFPDDTETLPESPSTYEQQDEIAWTLDDVQQIPTSPTTPVSSDKLKASELIAAFQQRHPQNSLGGAEHQPLPCPVILPQKRPGTKQRGFVRAYSPVLEDAGIDQATFMDFLDTFGKATKGSVVFDVINMACFVGGMIPEPFTQIVTMAVGTASTIGKRVDDHRKTNNFMNAMNDNLFKPHGLFCLIMTYKPQSNAISLPFNFGSMTSVSSPGFDMSRAVGKAAATPTGIKKYLNLKVSQGSTHEWELPDAAPLVFPAIDEADEQEKNKMKGAASFVGDYIDRRRLARFMAENPTSKLNVQDAPKFRSRFADPNHPVNSGSLIALVTGGAITQPSRGDRRNDRQERRADKNELGIDRGSALGDRFASRGSMSGYGHGDRMGGRLGGRREGLIGSLIRAGLNSRSGANSGAGDFVAHGDDNDETTYAAVTAGTRDSYTSHDEAPPTSGNSASLPYRTDFASAAQIPNDNYSAIQDINPTSNNPAASNRSGIVSNRGARKPAGPLGMVKKLIQEDVLYLMVVNMPTQEEIETALAKAQKRSGGAALTQGLMGLREQFQRPMR